MPDFNEWMSKHTNEIAEVQELLNERLSDDYMVLKGQLTGIESWFSRTAKLLADAQYMYTEHKSGSDNKVLIAEIRRLKEILAGQVEHIDKRISVSQSLLRVYANEFRHIRGDIQ